MQKEHERQAELKRLNEEERKKKEQEYEEMQKKHKQHPKVHHPVRYRHRFVDRTIYFKKKCAKVV